MILNIFFAVVIFALVLQWDVESDYKKWQNNIPVNHGKEALIRSLFLLPSVLLLSLPFPLEVWKTLSSIALSTFAYLFLFDGWYNIKRKQNWWFLGSVDKDDSWWDKLQRKIPLRFLKILKIGLPIIFLIIYIMS